MSFDTAACFWEGTASGKAGGGGDVGRGDGQGFGGGSETDRRQADRWGGQSDAIFRIYSMTKAVVSVAAMMLVEEGKLGLDVPASKYIPALGKMTVDEKTQDCEMTRPKKNLATRAANHCSSTMNFVRKSPGSSKTGRRLGTFSAEISTTAKPNQRLRPSSPPSAPVQGRLQSPPAKRKFLAVS
ncbi:MAG: serine hydrolase [Akkermansiaceae bacterium]|nr:serine hydrolase [Akkermansiaceae bacterium]